MYRTVSNGDVPDTGFFMEQIQIQETAQHMRSPSTDAKLSCGLSLAPPTGEGGWLAACETGKFPLIEPPPAPRVTDVRGKEVRGRL